MDDKQLQRVTFIKSACQSDDYPILRGDSGGLLPEVAVAGRSNVGKSTLLNHLFRHKKLVKASSTPGKTQMLNFFSVDDTLLFADLPGYGYAKVPLKVRKSWGPMVQSYLEQRESLRVILFLFDIRRMPNDDDHRFLDWVIRNEKAMILILTKVDKVNQKTKRDNTRKILEAFDTENIHHIHYSATKNVGRKELMILLNEAIKDETD